MDIVNERDLNVTGSYAGAPNAATPEWGAQWLLKRYISQFACGKCIFPRQIRKVTAIVAQNFSKENKMAATRRR